jgi:hypothetical protein
VVKGHDPSHPPNPVEWLALSELERIERVEEFHRRCGDFGENLRLHSSMHVVVENQLAEGHPEEARGALSRLRREGLDRHEAIHAIAAVLIEYLFPVLQSGENAQPFDTDGYSVALRNVAPGTRRS